ncbi:MAG: NTP transferase domain-containing protein [Acidobacteria bacterium]|nr:NTP transferase domain-containing protein [Acidobacteriota bacterium]
MGVVLAGGAGSRLGRSKAGLRLPGGPAGEPGPTLVEWAADRLAAAPRIDEILVAGGGAAIEPPANLRTASVTAVEDGPGAGPAAGVLGAARARPGSSLLVLACDLPLAPVRLLSTLASSGANLAAAAVDVSDRWTMNLTCALWTPPALSVLATRVARGDFSLYPLTRCSRLSIEPVAAALFGNPDDVLLNVNTAGDWDRARRLFDPTGLRPATT